jgi:hypothetical protein
MKLTLRAGSFGVQFELAPMVVLALVALLFA